MDINGCSMGVTRKRRKVMHGALEKVLKSRWAAREARSVSWEFFKYFRYSSCISASIGLHAFHFTCSEEFIT